MNIVIATKKTWNINNAEKFKNKYKNIHNVKIIRDMEELSYENIISMNPDYIFFPHWSWIISKEIFQNFNCVVFHMTDLPFGRGGSPLQNLIVRGFKETKITALKVTEKIDEGPIYFKMDLSLEGKAEEILTRASEIIFNHMIPEILLKEIEPKAQKGDGIYFERRRPEESEIDGQLSIGQMFDFIRMLDGEGYPKAFIEYGKYKISFNNAKMEEKKIFANVEIMEL